jgi:hypothetical protein
VRKLFPRQGWINFDEQLMAARRLLIVMLILLGLSTLAAALVPPQALREGTSTTSTTEETETTPPDTLPSGAALPQQRIKVGGRTVPVLSCPASLRRARRCKPIKAGDQLTLVVSSRKPDQLEMPAFGLVDAVGPNEPARFEILFQSAGSYKILFVSTGRIAARIEVEKRRAAKPDKMEPGKKKPARSRAPGEPDRS